MAVGRFDGLHVIATGHNDGSVQVWDSGVQPIGQPLKEHTDEVRALSIGQLVGRDVVVKGGDDRTVRIWDSDSREIVVLPMLQVR